MPVTAGTSRSAFPRLRWPGKRRRDWRSARAHAALAPALREERQWRTERRQAPKDNEIYQIFRRSSDATKWHHYFDIYAAAFAPFRDRPISFLEIGVHKGGSLGMWREYFHPDTRIVGIDNAPECARYEDPSAHVFVRIGEQQDEAFLRSVIEELGPFDIVLDDGSHKASHTLASFNVLFASGMSDDSLYAVEDLHTNYHPAFTDGPVRFLDLVKHMIDLMHAHYLGMHRRPPEAFSSAGEPAAFQVPAITTVLDQIQVFDSVVILHRRADRQTPVSDTSRPSGRQPAAAS